MMQVDHAGNDLPELTIFLSECEKLSEDRWDEFNESYSFDAAFHDGMTAADAVKDCRDWLDQ